MQDANSLLREKLFSLRDRYAHLDELGLEGVSNTERVISVIRSPHVEHHYAPVSPPRHESLSHPDAIPIVPQSQQALARVRPAHDAEILRKTIADEVMREHGFAVGQPEAYPLSQSTASPIGKLTNMTVAAPTPQHTGESVFASPQENSERPASNEGVPERPTEQSRRFISDHDAPRQQRDVSIDQRRVAPMSVLGGHDVVAEVAKKAATPSTSVQRPLASQRKGNSYRIDDVLVKPGALIGAEEQSCLLEAAHAAFQSMVRRKSERSSLPTQYPNIVKGPRTVDGVMEQLALHAHSLAQRNGFHESPKSARPTSVSSRAKLRGAETRRTRPNSLRPKARGHSHEAIRRWSSSVLHL